MENISMNDSYYINKGVYINAIIQIVYVVKISTKEATTNCCVHVQVSRCFVHKQHMSLVVVAVLFHHIFNQETLENKMGKMLETTRLFQSPV